MPFDPDDPRLTAYALGELDAADRLAIEAILRDDPDARGFVLGVEETARLLAEELRHEATAVDGLDPARREAIERQLSAPATLAIAAPPAKARFRAWMPLAAAAGIIGVAAAVTLPRYLGRRNAEAPIVLAQAEKGLPAAKGDPVARWGLQESRKAGEPEIVSADSDDFGATSPAAPAARPAPARGDALGEVPVTEALLAQKAGVPNVQYKAGGTNNLADLALRESKSARPLAAEAQPAPADSLGVPVSTAAASGRAAGGMAGGMGGVGGGMGAGGAGGMPAGGPQGRAGSYGFGRVATAPAPGSSPAGGAVALRSEAEGFERRRRMFGADASRSMARAEPTLDRAKLGRTVVESQPTADRLPAVVGTQDAGIANFQPNAPQTAAGRVTQSNSGQAGQAGGQNAPQMRGTQRGVYYYDTAQANAANMPAPAQQPQGAANNLVQSVQNQGPGGQRPGGQTQFSVSVPTLLTDGTTRDLGFIANTNNLSVVPAAPGAQPGQSAMPGNGAGPGLPGPQAPAGNSVASGLDLAQQVKPAAASPAPAARMMLQAPLAPAPQPGQGAALAPAVAMPPAVATDSKGKTEEALQRAKSPASEPAQVAGKPAESPPADVKAAINEKENLKDLVSEKKSTLASGEGKFAEADVQALAKAPVQVALAEEAKAVREEVAREVDLKQAEVRQLVEQANTLRRQVAREQTKVDREAYARFYDHPFLSVLPGNELSTFSIDVDTGSYANVRRFLSQGQLPPPDAVRIEELLNYFRYDDPAPKGDEPFSVNCEVAACPWDADHRLARVGLKGKTIEADKRPMSNLVFLIDVSGSMADLNKLPLLKAGMKLLVEQLTENDRVGIVTYSNDVKEVFPSTPCHRKAEILAAIDALQANGGTNGGAGIQMAYGMAEKNYLKGGGTNRVILATDGDFNVGMTKEELLATSEARAKSGIFLTVIGFGEGNLQEAFMEQLADKGNGHYLYIDTIDEARKALVRDLSGTLVAIAKDVKVQVEFNPDRCSSYRLIGYENRVMEAQDFRDDKKDAGEIGAGHSVTALYEIVPTGAPAKPAQADRPLKYRRSKGDAVADKEASPELFTVYLRYKQPDGDKASEISRGVVDDGRDFGRASTDLKFSASVAGFGMLLRGSPHRGSLTYPAVQEIASSALGADPNGDRKGFLELIRQAEQAEGIVEPPAPR
jgi:Ca-activated chloride channel family protein